MNTFIVKVFRGNAEKQYWEEFELKRLPGENVISSLMHIQKNPVNRNGKRVTPVVWEDGCLEEVCGSCSMLVNGKPRQACAAIIETIIQETGDTTITLAPLTKFPLIRDLLVDREIMFENLKKVHAWVDVDRSVGKESDGSGPKISPKKQEVMYSLSECMTCGCCTEACPQVDGKESFPFMGPSPIAQVRLFNAHPVGSMQKERRLIALMQKEGISRCGSAQNCERVCPKSLPLVESIAVMARETTKHAVKQLFQPAEEE